MKKNLLCLLMLFSLTAFSQIKFESGYYINNNNDTITGLIKNVDWRNNPTAFEFKITENSENQVITIDYAKEFGVHLKNKYVRADIDIEKSSNKTSQIGKNKEPQFTNERLFLKEIVSGTSKLYIYENNGLEKFFYSVNNSEIKQLIYIKYFPTSEEVRQNSNIDYNTVLANEYFKRQLWYDLKCKDDDQKKIKSLKYSTVSLSKYFNEFNQCKGDTLADKKEKVRTNFNLKLSAIYNIGSLNVSSFSPSFSPKFDDSAFGFGFETELILPFNNKKWGVILEPSYNTFKGDRTQLPPFGLSETTVVATADLKYFQIPFGVRHYFYLNQKSKLYANIIGNVRYTTEDSKIDFEKSTSEYTFTTTSFSFAAGLGLTFERFSGELRYFLKSNISNQPYTPIDFNNFSFILRYQIFSR